MAFVQHLLLLLFSGHLQLLQLLAQPSAAGAVAALAVVAIGAALVWTVLHGIAAWRASDRGSEVRDAMRRRSGRLQVVTLRDPDAPGRTRPRAPGAVPSAAV